MLLALQGQATLLDTGLAGRYGTCAVDTGDRHKTGGHVEISKQRLRSLFLEEMGLQGHFYLEAGFNRNR